MIPDTRRRVRRTADFAFRQGGMVQKHRLGYRKLTKEQAASGAFGPIGLRIALVPEQATFTLVGGLKLYGLSKPRRNMAATEATFSWWPMAGADTRPAKSPVA